MPIQKMGGGRCVSEFKKNINRAIRNPGIDEIHDLRVSIRRFRQALDLCEKPPDRDLVRRLKQLMKLAGSLRDCDIGSAYFEQAGLKEMQAQAERQRGKGEKALHDFLRKHRDPLLSAPDPDLAISSESARQRITLLAKRFWSRGDKAALRGASFDQLHRARIASKKLRYALEFFQPKLVHSAPDTLQPFVRIQKLLGEINDLRTILDLLSKASTGNKLLRNLRKQQDRKVKRFQEFWATSLRPAKEAMTVQMLEQAHQR